MNEPNRKTAAMNAYAEGQDAFARGVEMDAGWMRAFMAARGKTMLSCGIVFRLRAEDPAGLDEQQSSALRWHNDQRRTA